MKRMPCDHGSRAWSNGTTSQEMLAATGTARGRSIVPVDTRVSTQGYRSRTFVLRTLRVRFWAYLFIYICKFLFVIYNFICKICKRLYVLV